MWLGVFQLDNFCNENRTEVKNTHHQGPVENSHGGRAIAKKIR
jgi:hypothetical protein